MSRKVPSFGQLVEYMSDIKKSDEKYNIYHNIYSHSPQNVERDFMQNARHVIKRKNGVYLYHEILSIIKSQNLETSKQKEILREIALEYAQKRGKDNLVFATLHDDHAEHLHYHFLISANILEDSKKTRLSKAQFSSLKKNLEAKVLEKYPELEQKMVMNKKSSEKLSKKGAELKRRTGKTPKRDRVKEKLKKIFAHSKSKQELFALLQEEGFELYVRGKTIGIKEIESGMKYRLKTIGLLDEFHTMSEGIELDKTPEKNKTQEKQNSKTKDKRTKPEDTKQKSREGISKTHKQRLDTMRKLRKQQKDEKNRSNKK